MCRIVKKGLHSSLHPGEVMRSLQYALLEALLTEASARVCSSQWPISETNITCNARDVIWRTDYGKNSEFLVFMAAEDSSEGFVKAATWKKVYKCLEVC